MSRISKEPEVRKNELLDVSEALFMEKGYDKTSISDIVNRIGVAQGTFYYHFASKDAIVEALADRYVAKLIDILKTMIIDPDITALRKIEIITAKLFVLNQQNNYLMDFVHREKNAILHQKLVMKIFKIFTPKLEQLLEDGKRDSGFTIAYPHETAQMMLLMAEHLQELAAFSDDEDIIKLNKLAMANMVERLLGIKAGSIDFDRE